MDLLPFPLLAVALAVLGAVAAVPLTLYAARRTAVQPLALALPDEVRVLVGVLAEPRRLPYLTALAPADFAAGANARIWAALLAVCEQHLAQLPDDPSDEDCERVAGLIAEQGLDLHTALQGQLAATATAAADLRRLAYLAQVSASGLPTDEEVSDSAAAVLLTGTDRNRLSGMAPVVASLDPDSVDPAHPPLVRFRVRPSRFRRVLSAAALGVTAALAPALAHAAGFTGPAFWVAVACLIVLAAGSLVIALVDLDTMYVDLRAFVLTTAGAWLAALVVAALSGQWSRLVAGLVVVAIAAVVFEGANRVYRWRRGVDGQGFGDTLILLATAGVPPALTGDPTVGFWSVMAALVTGVAGWVVGRLAGKVDRQTPFAFGPYLAAGWVVGWVAYLVLVS